MNINLTFIFQVFNFLTAYYILEKLFFRVAIAVINDHDKERQKIEQLIFDKQEALKSLKLKIKEQLKLYQKNLLELKPSLEFVEPHAFCGVEKKTEQISRQNLINKKEPDATKGDLVEHLKREILGDFRVNKCDL